VETLLNPQVAEGRGIDCLKGLCAGRAKKDGGSAGKTLAAKGVAWGLCREDRKAQCEHKSIKKTSCRVASITNWSIP